MPHALLFNGPAGLGKRAFALALSRGLLCTNPTPDGFACDTCSACHLIAAGTHPDHSCLTPAPEKTQIVIDQVRDLCAELALKSHAGGYKVAILAPAEAMNNAAANSLLKTLEEPSDNSLLILISEQASRLPATIRSRCQLLRFPIPDGALTATWLAEQGVEDTALRLRMTDGAPLPAKDLPPSLQRDRRVWLQQFIEVQQSQRDPVALAAKWSTDPGLQPLYWLSGFLMDMIKLHYTSEYSIKNIDLLNESKEIIGKYSAAELHLRLERIWHTLRLATQTNVNRQLLAEALLIEWSPARKRVRAGN